MVQQTIGLYEGKKAQDYYATVKDGTAEEIGGVDTKVLGYLKSILPKSLNEQVALELGCGDCRWAGYLHELGAKRVIGLDNSPDMLALAKQRKGERCLNRLGLIRADMQELPFWSGSVDLVLASFCLMYFADLEGLVKEIARVLTSGGKLYIATNLVAIDDSGLLGRLKGEVIPIELGAEGQTILLENVVQPLEQYHASFRGASLVVQDEQHFAPDGLSVPSHYKYRQAITLSKAVFQLSKVS